MISSRKQILIVAIHEVATTLEENKFNDMSNYKKADRPAVVACSLI
jgi:hypothetical protein